MRWFIEVSRVGESTETEKYCLEAKQWQSALQEARKLRGDSGPLSKFSIELLDEGYRAVDPTLKIRYVVAKAPNNAPLSVSGNDAAARAAELEPTTEPMASPEPLEPPAPEPAPKTDPMGAPVPSAPSASSTPATTERAEAKPQAAARPKLVVPDDRAPSPATPPEESRRAIEAQASSHTTQPSLDAAKTPDFQLIRKREEEPTAQSPIAYREYAYAVKRGTDRHSAELLLWSRFEDLKATLRNHPAGKFVQLAVFDHIFERRPVRPPIATLAWKDWRGEPVIQFPSLPQKDSVPPPPAIVPTGAAAASNAPAPAPSSSPPAAAAPSWPPGAVASWPPASARSSPPAAAPSSPPSATPSSRSSAPSSPPTVAQSAPPRAAPSAPPTAAPPSSPPAAATPSWPAAVPAPSAQRPAAVTSERSERASEASRGGGGTQPPVRPSSPPQTQLSAAVVTETELAAAAAPAAEPRRRRPGEDLIGELFESMHDLHFMTDVVSGAQFVLSILDQMLPSDGVLVHVFDINTRHFVVVRASGPNADKALLHRTLDKEPLFADVMRRTRCLRVNDATEHATFKAGRWQLLGVTPNSVLCGPVQQGGRYLGMIELANPQGGGPYYDTEANALDYICEQFADFVAARPIVVDADVVLPKG